MASDTQIYWNKSYQKLPEGRLPSTYAKDKEKLFPRNSVVCDLGGGDGTDSFYFIEKGHNVYLYDVSDRALGKARDKAKDLGIENKLSVEQIDLDQDNIPVKDNFFDVVYARLSLHYFYPDRTAEILADIYRVLKKGGTAYLAVKSIEDKKEMEWLETNSQKIEEGIYSDGGHIKSRFTKEQFKTILEKAGIENYTIGEYAEFFGDKKIYLKSSADKLLYTEIVIKK